MGRATGTQTMAHMACCRLHTHVPPGHDSRTATYPFMNHKLHNYLIHNSLHLQLTPSRTLQAVLLGLHGSHLCALRIQSLGQVILNLVSVKWA